MPETRFPTTWLQDWLARIRTADPSARDELAHAAQSRFEQLARRMLSRSPTVRQRADTGDVFQRAVLRLLRSLESPSVSDTREFMNLAAVQVRRGLLDLARRYQGPHGRGANDAAEGPAVPEGETQDVGAAGLGRWVAFHQAVEGLPAEEREVFGLTFYHGWTQAHVAELFGVDGRTVRRRWRRACDALNQALGGDLPE